MADATLGFIGLGVMGAPMCRNLARKSGRPVIAYDLRQPACFFRCREKARSGAVADEIPSTRTVVDCSTAPVALAQASGAVEPARLFETLAKGSADSFALRNHGMRALLPGEHPENAFPVRYMLERTLALGLGDAYHTAVLEAVRKQEA